MFAIDKYLSISYNKSHRKKSFVQIINSFESIHRDLLSPTQLTITISSVASHLYLLFSKFGNKSDGIVLFIPSEPINALIHIAVTIETQITCF